MTNEEMIVVLSSLLDEKLKPIELHLKEHDKRFDKLEERMDRLEERMDRLEERMDKLDERMERLELRMERLEERMDKLEERVDILEENMNSMGRELRRVALMQEQRVLPLLSEMHSYYMDVFRRYERGADKQDGMLLDISVVKDVVVDHSDRLEKAGI